MSNNTVFRLISAVIIIWGICGAVSNVVAEVPALQSPYVAESLTWLRGNLHTHTTNSDGNRPPQEVVNIYAEMGYDFLVLSNHDKVTDPTKLDPKGMTLIPGNEITANGPHMLHVGAKTVVPALPDTQEVLNRVVVDGGFAVMNHPNWTADYNHCDLAVLEKLQGYAGIEIFNGVILFHEGSELATDKWDRLLAQGRHIWGFASDDSHNDNHRGLGWVMVQTSDRSAKGIVEAMHTGRFYASTGVTVDNITVKGQTVFVWAGNAQLFRVYGARGRMLATAKGNHITYTADPQKDISYIRVEAFGEGDTRAWLQPMFWE